MASDLVRALGFGPSPERDLLPDRRDVFDITEIVRCARHGEYFGLSGISRILPAAATRREHAPRQHSH